MNKEEILRESITKSLKEFIKQNPGMACAVLGAGGKQFLVPDNKKKRGLFRCHSIADQKF